jgi:hypothetical protein
MICGTGASSITERSPERMLALPSENVHQTLGPVEPAAERGRNADLPITAGVLSTYGRLSTGSTTGFCHAEHSCRKLASEINVGKRQWQ